MSKYRFWTERWNWKYRFYYDIDIFIDFWKVVSGSIMDIVIVMLVL